MGNAIQVGSVFIVSALAQLIVVCISVPILHKIFFLEAHLPNDEYLRLGMWGYCVESKGHLTCSDKHLGYKIGDAIENYGAVVDRGHLTDLANVLSHGLSKGLVLHIIAAIITFFACIFAICSNRISHIIGGLVAFSAFLVQTIAFGIDLGLFVTARHRINDALGSGSAKYGAALWLSLIVMILLLLSSVAICFEHTHKKRVARGLDQKEEILYDEGRDTL